MSYLQTALKVVNQVSKDNNLQDRIRPIGKGTVIKLPSEDRQKTLLDCMTATWKSISAPYFKTGYKLTPDVKKAEFVIEKLQADVLEGKAKLEDFRDVCRDWEKAVQETINRDKPKSTYDEGKHK